MIEPVTAADVIADAIDTATNCFLSRKHLRDATDDVVAALREACGGGDIVIRTDGTLAMLKRDGTVKSSGHWVPLIAVVPVGRGA